MSGLTKEQQELFLNLRLVIIEVDNIGEEIAASEVSKLLAQVSKEDFLSVFRKVNQEILSRDNIHLPKIFGIILSIAKEKDALREIAEDIVCSEQEDYGSGLEAFWRCISEDDRTNIKAKLANEAQIKDGDQWIIDEISKVEENILFEQLIIAIENKKGITDLLKGVSKDVFLSIVKSNRLFSMSAAHGNYEAVRDILSIAKEHGILKEFKEDIDNLAGRFASIKCRSSSNVLNAVKEGCGLEDFWGILSETKRKSVIERLNKDASCKAMKVSVAFSVIAALAVGGGCFAAGINIGLSFGIAVAAAVVAGFTAGCIAYAVSKPSSEFGGINIQQKQETELQDMSNRKSCHSC